MMKMKRQENDLIWEMYDYAEDAEVVMNMEPMGEMEVEPEVELEPDGDLDDVLGDEDDNEIVLHSLRKLVKRSGELLELCASEKLETWMVAKIIKAEDYVSDVWEQLDDKADFANDGFEDSDNISL
jgi:hypothetical protein